MWGAELCFPESAGRWLQLYTFQEAASKQLACLTWTQVMSAAGTASLSTSWAAVEPGGTLYNWREGAFVYSLHEIQSLGLCHPFRQLAFNSSSSWNATIRVKDGD